jgi:6-phosphogluconolactonase (cycloisomerase 2 family)
VVSDSSITLRPGVGRSRLRRLRGRFPVPRLWALGFGASVPSGAYSASGVVLSRPESIRRSWSGNRAVVSNTLARGISVFTLRTRGPGTPALRFDDALIDEKRLLYAHGAVFAPDDQSVIALGEYAHAMTAYALQSRDGKSALPVLWSLCGPQHGLENPADVAVHPGGRWLVVANRLNTGLAALRMDDRHNRTVPELLGTVYGPALNSFGLSAPHGVAFSHCGRFLFVTHKPYSRNVEDSGQSAVSVFPCTPDGLAQDAPEPVAIRNYDLARLHHIAAHPKRSLLAITNSRGDAEILEWDEAERVLHKRGAIDVFRIGEGAKGIEFTASGDHLMITSELNEILFFRVSRFLGR